jgi:hypothetical protein
LFFCALHGRGTLRVPDIGRETSRPYNRSHHFAGFLRGHKKIQKEEKKK